MIIRCEHCQRVLDVRSDVAGKVARCPACQGLIRVPRETQSAAQIMRYELDPAEAPLATVVAADDVPQLDWDELHVDATPSSSAELEPAAREELALAAEAAAASSERPAPKLHAPANAARLSAQQNMEHSGAFDVDAAMEGLAHYDADTSNAHRVNQTGAFGPDATRLSGEKIRVLCGRCQRNLGVDAALAGQLGLCPACQAVIVIPRPDGSIPSLLEATRHTYLHQKVNGRPDQPGKVIPRQSDAALRPPPARLQRSGHVELSGSVRPHPGGLIIPTPPPLPPPVQHAPVDMSATDDPPPIQRRGVPESILIAFIAVVAVLLTFGLIAGRACSTVQPMDDGGAAPGLTGGGRQARAATATARPALRVNQRALPTPAAAKPVALPPPAEPTPEPTAAPPATPVPPPPLRVEMLGTSSSLFAVGLYRPAPPGKLYLNVRTKFEWAGPEPVQFRPGEDNPIVLNVDGQTLPLIGRRTDLQGLDLMNPEGFVDRRPIILDTQGPTQTVELMFLVPEDGRQARLEVPGAQPVAVPIARALPNDRSEVAQVVGAWRKHPEQPQLARYSDSIIDAIRAGLQQEMVISAQPSGFLVRLRGTEIQGVAEQTGPREFLFTFRNQLDQQTATARLFENGQALLLYFRPDDLHQFVFLRAVNQ